MLPVRNVARERGESLRWPISGAVTAIAKPATVMATLSTVDVYSLDPNAGLVRYTVNTNVSITALYADVPVSHRHHMSTRAREPPSPGRGARGGRPGAAVDGC